MVVLLLNPRTIDVNVVANLPQIPEYILLYTSTYGNS